MTTTTATPRTASRRLLTGPASATSPVLIPSPPPVATPPPPPPPPPPCNIKSNGTNVAVPDRRAAASAVVVSNCAGKASRRTREVRIVHPRRGDVVVELIAPNGSVKRLKAASRRDRGVNVSAAWTLNMSARNRNGTWRLRVRDSYQGSVGYVDSWTLTV